MVKKETVERDGSIEMTDDTEEKTVSNGEAGAAVSDEMPPPPDYNDVNQIELDVDEPKAATAAECQPLKGDVDGVQKEIDVDGEDENGDDENGDDWNGTAAKKGPWDKRCMTVGVLLLLLIVCGAILAITLHRFKGEDMYDVKFASYFGDHMVLQRAPSRAIIWGYGPVTDKNITITLQLQSDNLQKTYTSSVKGSSTGPPVWRVLLEPVTEPGPFVITVTLDDEPEPALHLVDVLFGDVWVCAGQNNMQFPVHMLANGSDELEQAHNYPDVRLFVVSSLKSPFPKYDLHDVQLEWSLPSKSSLNGDTVLPSQFRSHFSALCWLYGRQLQRHLGRPIGLIAATYSVGTIDMWASVDVLEKCNIEGQSTSGIWNSMINPLLQFSIFGVIWYQGESDALIESHNYNCTFINLVRDWREKLYTATQGATNPTFPFGFVQLAPNRAGDELTYGFTGVRWRQTANFGYVPNSKLPNVFMAVAIDLPDLNSTTSIHSRYKADIAERLVRGALSVAYGETDVTFAGPVPLRYKAANNQLKLHLKTSSLDIRDTAGFEVCCSSERNASCAASYIKVRYAPGREWLAAPIIEHSESSLTLSTATCRAPSHVVAVRYAWRETPCALRACAVYGLEGGALPMPPYICTQLIDDGREHSLITSQVNIL